MATYLSRSSLEQHKKTMAASQPRRNDSARPQAVVVPVESGKLPDTCFVDLWQWDWIAFIHSFRPADRSQQWWKGSRIHTSPVFFLRSPPPPCPNLPARAHTLQSLGRRSYRSGRSTEESLVPFRSEPFCERREGGRGKGSVKPSTNLYASMAGTLYIYDFFFSTRLYVDILVYPYRTDGVYSSIFAPA